LQGSPLAALALAHGAASPCTAPCAFPPRACVLLSAARAARPHNGRSCALYCGWLGGVVWGAVVGVRVESCCSRSRPGPPTEQFPHFPHPFTIRAASGHDPLASEVLSTVFISAERSRLSTVCTRARRDRITIRETRCYSPTRALSKPLWGFVSLESVSPFSTPSPPADEGFHMAGASEVPAAF
jgi:hypothetical protein